MERFGTGFDTMIPRPDRTAVLKEPRSTVCQNPYTPCSRQPEFALEDPHSEYRMILALCLDCTYGIADGEANRDD